MVIKKGWFLGGRTGT